MWMINMKAVLDIVSQYCPDDDGSCSKAGVDLREMLDEIEGLDETEVQPVKHGRWINLTPMGQRAKQRMTWHGCVTWVCSECNGAARFFSEDLPYELCPHCGRIMTFGGGEEEQRAHAEYMERAAKELASEDGDSE